MIIRLINDIAILVMGHSATAVGSKANTELTEVLHNRCNCQPVFHYQSDR